ncbi:MAG TPA: DUF1648 domain-containing protein [Verrucomicrobiae bacterium]
MLIGAIAILSVGLVMFCISLPLAYRKVSMNSFYGIRIPAAFESEQRWYDINAYGGRQLAAWSWFIITAGIVGLFLPDGCISVYLPVSSVITLLAVLVPVVRILRWSNLRRPEDGLPTSSDAIDRTPNPAPSKDFLRKRTLVPAIALVLLCVAYVIFIGWVAQSLPSRVATHFGAAGRANGWMPREVYLHFISILGVTIAMVIMILGLVVGVLQSRFDLAGSGFSRPQIQNRSYLCGDIIWFACLLLCFLAGTHYLVIEANRNHPAHLPSSGLAILIAGFIVGNIGWAILLFFHLMKKER